MTDWLTAQSQVPSHMLLLLLFVWPLVGVAFCPHSLGCMAQRVPLFLGGPKESLRWSTVRTTFSHEPYARDVHRLQAYATYTFLPTC